jgi:hypothetical protein
MDDLRTQLIEVQLKRLRAVLASPELVYFVPRTENRTCLFELNLTQQEVISTLRSLVAAEYVKGPEADENGSPGQVWVFRKLLKRREIYIKFKLYDDDGVEKLTIISFHL